MFAFARWLEMAHSLFHKVLLEELNGLRFSGIRYSSLSARQQSDAAKLALAQGLLTFWQKLKSALML